MRLGKALLVAVLLAVTLTPVASAGHGPGIRVLTWNIFHGGREPDERNLANLLDQVVALRPDVFFSVETYGSGDEIERALSRRAGKGRYTGVRVTDRPDGQDNLWLFTRFPVTEVYPKPSGGQVTDFHFGGARVWVPGRGEVNLFSVWLPYTNPWNGYLIDENAAGIRAGLEPRHPAGEVARAERAQTEYVTDIIEHQLPRILAGNTDPVLIGGDFNTLPAADWRSRWANCPNHFGMSYPLRATEVVTAAGFVDTYRAANPDTCAAPGTTWSPLPAERLITEQRIDFTFARGPFDVRGSLVVDERMRGHGPGAFYSDHAAVVSDLTLRR
ncbi:endonuclease/exonuclease/phosphatase family protein [Amycolatopsis cihanbeyliensis]|uniref:Exonuclease III n=1 Tax=Amycolatopsis cihanbeyliensis TaxID=1128664 RepID=A0A542DMP9_AMYCI|nr:endonuclease/exonuclease/phosphatase family protein [Amycolatopsis cihanbeyliensis]TQJ04370.1 exonuclease III [Amycolatopsis cihanbeyliensis]